MTIFLSGNLFDGIIYLAHFLYLFLNMIHVSGRTTFAIARSTFPAGLLPINSVSLRETSML